MTKEEKIRLQKILADRGMCSRREAEAWIEEGLIQINGKIAKLGDKADAANDAIKVRGKLLNKDKAKTVALAMNKPKGVLCSNRDSKNESQTVFEILPEEFQRIKLFCAGRLDKNTEGLLILTNDGNLANRISHPSNEITKRYLVTLSKRYKETLIPKLLKGVKDEGEHLFASKVIAAKRCTHTDCRLEVHLHQGRKREIRRLFNRFGHFVTKLRRIQIGGYKLRGIPLGGIKKLSEKEINSFAKKIIVKRRGI